MPITAPRLAESSNLRYDWKDQCNWWSRKENDAFSALTITFDNETTGSIFLDGGAGDDTFYANYEALLEGKLSIDGNTGVDMVDVRTTATNSALTFNDADMFSNMKG